MKTYLRFLYVVAFVTCLSFEAIAGTPTVSTGYDASAILKAGVRLKSFNNGPGGEIYLGKPDLGIGANRVEIDFGYTGQWQPSNHIKFEYTPVGTNNLKVTVDANIQYILTYNLGDASRLNYLQVDVVGRQAGTTVDFNNVTLNGNPLGNFSGTGDWYTWQVNGLDFTSGFIVEGDLLLSGTQPTSSELNKLQLSAGFVRPDIVWVSPTYTPGGTNDGHTWRYDAFDNIKEGIDSVIAGGTVIVGDGTYNEDIIIPKSLKLFSVNGQTTTIVNGQTAGWSGGALRINSSKVIVGGVGKGFTFNSKTSGGTPLFACYVSGARDSLWIEENKFVAAPRNPGDIETYALLTDGGQTNQTYQNNIFDGMSTPRFLVYVNGFADVGVASTNIDFIGNTFTTLAGGLTLSSSGGEVTGNYFQGTAGIGLNTSSSNVISGNFFQGVGSHFTNHTSSGVDVDAVTAANTFDRRVVIRNAGSYRTETFPWGTFVIVRGNIQGAVNAASAGDSVIASAGTYNETVQIGKTLSLAGAGKTQTIIRPTVGLTTGIGHKYDANMIVAMLVSGATNVTVKDMTIDGNEAGLNAVVLWNSSSGTLQNLKIMRPMLFSGMQTGQGLAIDATSPGSVSLNVDNCEFEQWNKNAIDVVNGNSTTSNGGNITFSINGGTFTGRGNTATTAQNCIVVWERGGGTINGSIQNASFADVNYTPTSNEASTILQYGSPNGTISPISGCSFTNTEIYVGEAGGSNHSILITGNIFDGVDPAYASVAQLAAIEDKIIHKMDDNTSGLITFRLKNVVATTNNLGIQQGINAASPGDTVLVAAGTYRDSAYNYVDIIINKSINLVGTGSGSTMVELHQSNNPPGSHMDGVSIGASDVLIQGMKFTKLPSAPYATGFNIRAGVNVTSPPPGNTFSNIILRDVESEYSQGMNVCFDGSYIYQNVVIQNCNFHHGGERNFYESPNTTINGLTITNSHFDNCGQQPGGDPIGFNLQGATTSLSITGGTFNENINGGIVIRGVNGAIISGVTVQHSGYKSSGDRSGIGIWEDVATTSNIQIINSTVTNCGGRGVMFGTWGKSVSNVSVTGGIISGSGNNGVMLYGGGSGGSLSNIVIDSVTITTSGTNNYQTWADAGTSFNNITVRKCTVTNPTAGNNIYFGAATGASYFGTNSITECNITNAPPSFRGIRIYDQSGISIAIHKNKITGNGYGILAQTSVLQDAKENWWGHWSGPADPKPLPNTPNYNNPTGLGDSVSSFVDYKPWYIDPSMDSLSTDTIWASTVGSGTILPAGTIIVNYGGNQTFTIAPAWGHHIDSVVVDGVNQGAISSYPFTNVTSNHTIIAYFSINTFTIDASKIGNGTITPSGSVSVNYGGNQTFTIAPALGHHIDSVVVDGVNQGAISSYPFINVTSNHTIIAYFSINTFTIDASKIGNGTITPSGSVSVNYGGNQTFTIAPALEHHIDSVVVDGVNQGAISSYPFTNVTLDHTIIAYFSINTYTLNVAILGSGTITKIPDQTIYNHGSEVQLAATPLNLSWKFVKWTGDINSISNPITIAMDGNKNITATLDRDSAYLVMYRSFSPESLAFDKDNKGKINKYVLRKPVRVKFSCVIPNDLNKVENIIHLHFNPEIIVDNTDYPFSITPEPTLITHQVDDRIFDVSWENGIQPGDSIKVYGWGAKGKRMSITYAWHSYAGGKHNKPYVENQWYLPMPNRVNALYETFAYGGFQLTNGLLVGKPFSDSAKQYGWLRIKKFSNVLKSLLEKRTLQIHTGTERGFDKISGGRKLVREQGVLPPKKHDNVLLAEMIALKLNIAASALGKIPKGFGELLYDDNTSNPLNGMMVKEIAAFSDLLMMGQYDQITRSKVFAAPDVFTNLFATIQRINNSFEGTLDTISFANSLMFKGVKPLIDVSYLRANPEVIPEIIQSTELELLDIPTVFSLYQNYPNPFNPFTTIRFDLPENAIVNLKVYNMLGQEVVTLVDKEDMDEGTQEVEFNADGLSSGVYFYRLTAEGIPDDETNAPGKQYVNVKKMLLIK